MVGQKPLKKSSPQGENRPSQSQNKEIYDVIHSDELHELYQKNAQLLSQLSATGRHNNILQSELTDLIKEKSQVDIKNNFLKKEVDSLKEKMSGFRFQYKKFNEQSMRLKEQLDSTPPFSVQKQEQSAYTHLQQKYNQQISALQLLEKKEIVYKNQIKKLESDCLHAREKERDYKTQIQNLKISPQQYQKKEEYLKLQIHNGYKEEINFLKNNYENLRRVIQQQEEGFQSIFKKFRKKYLQDLKLNHNKQFLEKDIKEIHRLKAKINEVIRQNLSLKKMIENNNTEIQMQEKIRDIQLISQKKIQHLKESHERERQGVKNENIQYKKQLEDSYKEKLKHMRVEMENDLCNEKRRVEVLKKMKDNQIKDLKNQLKEIQQEDYELKTSNETFKKVHHDIEKKLHNEISKNENLRMQNKQLEHLWQSLQKNLEERNQQVQSLQKLNRDLSMALNEKNRSTQSLESQLKKSSLLPEMEKEILKESSPKKESQDLKDVLVDLYLE